MLEKPRFAIISDPLHQIQLNAFMDSRFRWYSLSSLKNNEEKLEGGLLLIDNLPEIVYKNANQLSKIAYSWITLEQKHTSSRLTQIAQKVGVILHFFQYPFKTEYWSIQFLNELVEAFELQTLRIGED